MVEMKGGKKATTADLKATSGDLMAALDRLEAAIEAQTWRLTVRLGGILIAGMIATGFLLFASVPFLAP
ncbi:MAG: hypothetical protein QOJ86_4302 [Bradyrhizobium sp.]|jgi:hypothetical protein|nr:hypothetical protein [Bradyrhizobium sp.]